MISFLELYDAEYTGHESNQQTDFPLCAVCSVNMWMHIFFVLDSSPSGPDVSSSAGFSANTHAASDNRRDTGVDLSFPHTGRSQFQELNWLLVALRNDNLQEVPWSTSHFH